jgi:hypothetical protein
MPETYRRKDSVVQRDVAGQTLLVPIQGEAADLQRVFSLNAVGRLVWEALATGRTEGELAVDVMENFDVDAERASADVRAFVARLAEAGLVESA